MPPSLLRSAAGACVLLFVLLLGQCRPEATRHQNGFCSVGGEELNDALDSWRAGFAEIGNASNSGDSSVGDGPIHEGRGNGVAPGALLDGVCDMAAMSRPMTDAEVDRFVRRYGKAPRAIPAAVEALAIIVPEHSPLRSVSRQQLKQLYGEGPHLLSEVFPEVESDPEWGMRDLSLHGLNTASDRYRWFKDTLELANLSDRVREESGPLALVDAIASSRHGFGYARATEMSAGVRALPLRLDSESGREAIALDATTVQSGRYPLRRYYYLYLPPDGARPLDSRTRQFMEYVLSDAGQQRLAPLGLYPLSSQEQRQAQAALRSAD